MRKDRVNKNDEIIIDGLEIENGEMKIVIDDNANKNDSDAKIFLQNLSKEVSRVRGNPEEIERLNFTIRGRVLSPEAKLTYERIRILDFFAHHFEPTIDFVKFNKLRGMIESLSDAIKSRNYEYDVIAQIIVHIELELGMDVLLTTVLLELAKDDLKEKQYKDINNTNFYKLYDHYLESSHSRGRRR